MKAFTLEADLVLNSSGFAQSLGSVEGQLNSEQSLAGFAAWGTTIGNLASSAFRKAFTAGVQFAKDVVDKTMNFESTMSHVESVTQASASEMDAITKKARELGGSTIYTAEQVGEAMFYMGQAGWKTEQILAGIGPVMDLAAASGDDLSRVSDIVTDSIQNFGLTANDTQHYVDVLAQTARNSNTNISMMGEAFKYVSPVAKALNYSIEDVGLALGLAANNGIKASQAGTSLRMILSTLIDPSSEAQEAMDKLGVTIDDDTGKIRPFLDVMDDFRNAAVKAGYNPEEGRTIEEIAAAEEKYAAAVEKANKARAEGKITEKQEANQIKEALDEFESYTHFNQNFLKSVSDIAGLRGISTLLSIMNATEEDYARVQEEILQSENAAAEMAAVQRDNLKGDVTLLNSAVDDLQLTIGNMANDSLRGLTQSATYFVDRLNTALTAGQGKLNADQMERIMDKYEAWNNTSNFQFITKSNRATELYRTVADELEAAGASAEEIQNVLNTMLETGDASHLLAYIQTLQDAQAETNALKDAADAAAGDYDINFHINTTGSVPNPKSYVPGGGTGGGGRDTTVMMNAKGAWDVPYDDYVTRLHRDEMVLNATQARNFRNNEGGTNISADDIAAAVRAAVMDLAMEVDGEAYARVTASLASERVNRNIGQMNRKHAYGYGG